MFREQVHMQGIPRRLWMQVSLNLCLMLFWNIVFVKFLCDRDHYGQTNGYYCKMIATAAPGGISTRARSMYPIVLYS